MLIGLVVGVPGLILFLFLFTKWDVTHYNENLFLANPITFLAFPLGFWTAVGSQKAQRWLGTVWLVLGTSTVLLLVLKLLPSFDQDTHLPMALLVPLNLGCALAHAGLVKRSQHAAASQAAAGLPG
jgi:FtsH-binding integral membrane protein